MDIYKQLWYAIVYEYWPETME